MFIATVNWLFNTNSIMCDGKQHFYTTCNFIFVIFGQFNSMRPEKKIAPILRAMIRCITQAELLVNSCVHALLYIIDSFVWYVVAKFD